MAGQATPKKSPPSPNGAPTLTPLGHYAGRPDIAISRQVTVVGSKTGSRLHLASSTVSQSHALIVNCAAGAYIRDLASRTHVYVNGKDRREADLNDGDLLQIGKFKFQYNAGVEGAGVEPGRDGHQPAPDALLNVEGGEMPVPIEGRSVLIGRRPTCDVPLIEESVSTAHAILFEMNGRRYVRDLASRTGTFVNGERINPQAELKFGDEIRIGDTTIGYASAIGEMPEHAEVDEMDHLVSTAPLGTAALEAPDLAEDEGATPADEPIVVAGGSRHGNAGEPQAIAPFVDAEPPQPDQIQLDVDPDVAGPGDTAVLPAHAEAPRKAPTLKAQLDDELAQADTAEARDETVEEAAPSAEEADVVDEALGLTPDAQRREQARAEDLGGSRRGWRGMTSDDQAVPLAEHPGAFEAADEAVADVAPEAAPEIVVPEARQPREAPDDLPAEAGHPSGTDVEPEADLEADAQRQPVAEPKPELEPAPEAAIPMEPEATPPPRQSTPAHVTVGEEVETPPDTLPAETFDMEVDESAPLAQPEALTIDDELHLPPVIDETLGDEEELEALPLTPEEGAPLDLSVDETPSVVDEPPPSLVLREPAPEETAETAEPETEPVAEAPAPEPEPVAATPVAEPKPAPEPVAEEVVESAPAPGKKPKRKRAPRKRKGAVEPVVEEGAAASTMPEPSVEPEPEPQPVAEAPAPAPEPEPPLAVEETPAPEVAADRVAEPRATDDAVEVLDETHPTPESALGEEAVADLLAEPLPVDDSVETSGATDLTDTSFGRAVDSFVGESTGELVEARADAAPEEGTGEEPAQDEAALAEAEEALTPEETAVEASAGPSDAEAAAIDDLIADVMGEEPAAVEERERPVEALDFEFEDDDDAAAPAQPAARDEVLELEPSPVGETTSEPEPESVAEAPAEEAPLEPEPVARRDIPSPQEQREQPLAPAPASPPPVAHPPTPARAAPASPAAWGPNQEHFLGGMPLKLNKPVKTPGRAGVGAGQAAARQGQPLMPPPPPRATRPNARTRSPFDVFPPDVNVKDQGAMIPPYTGGSGRATQVSTGFDGLALPPVRQTDVFSQMTTPAAFAAGLAPDSDDDDIFSRGARLASQQQQQGGQRHEATPSDAPAPPSAPPARGAGAPAAERAEDGASPADAVWADDPGLGNDEPQPVGAGAARQRPLPTPPTFPASNEDQPAPAKRKRRWFGLRFLLVAMLVLGLGAAGTIYGVVRKQTTVVGKLRFDNFDSLKTIEQSNLLAQQKQLLGEHALRESARKALAQRHADVDPGFLADAVSYERATRLADWAPGPQKGAFAFQYNGKDEKGDAHRVRAVMLALYEANAKQLPGNGTVRESLAALKASHAKSEQRVADLKAQVERLNVVALKMPDRKLMADLLVQVGQLEKAHGDASRRARALRVDLEGMRQAMPENPQPAGTAQAPVVDPELAKMQQELATANKALAAGKAARAEAAQAAQARLDAALESFEKQIAGAEALANDNPELSAYVAAAQALQTETRELTDKLIRRQQEQQRQLGELKTRLGEKLEARRADVYKKDPKLQELSDELAIVQRQYNAALGGGAKKEAEEYKSHIDLLDQMIKGRQAILGDDALLADAIDQLQKVIDAQQRGLDNDRKHTESELERMQAAFTRSQPAVEKMPEAQKALAASLAKQLEEINAARKTYNVAADAVATASDEELKETEAAASALAAKIETRRKDLTAQAAKAATAEQEQARLTAMKDREAELAAAQIQETETLAALDAAQKNLRTMQSAEAEARDAGERRDALQTERVAAEKELAAQLRLLEGKSSEAARTVEPIPPTDADVEMTVHDPRPTYALASVGGIVAVFTLLILFTAAGTSAEPDEAPPMADFAPEPVTRLPPVPMPQPGNGGNGTPAAADAPSHVGV